jgi:hypothetical protein
VLVVAAPLHGGAEVLDAAALGDVVQDVSGEPPQGKGKQHHGRRLSARMHFFFSLTG